MGATHAHDPASGTHPLGRRLDRLAPAVNRKHRPPRHTPEREGVVSARGRPRPRHHYTVGGPMCVNGAPRKGGPRRGAPPPRRATTAAAASAAAAAAVVVGQRRGTVDAAAAVAATITTAAAATVTIADAATAAAAPTAAAAAMRAPRRAVPRFLCRPVRATPAGVAPRISLSPMGNFPPSSSNPPTAAVTVATADLPRRWGSLGAQPQQWWRQWLGSGEGGACDGRPGHPARRRMPPPPPPARPPSAAGRTPLRPLPPAVAPRNVAAAATTSGGIPPPPHRRRGPPRGRPGGHRRCRSRSARSRSPTRGTSPHSPLSALADTGH